jgi:hypothetical protein
LSCVFPALSCVSTARQTCILRYWCVPRHMGNAYAVAHMLTRILHGTQTFSTQQYFFIWDAQTLLGKQHLVSGPNPSFSTSCWTSIAMSVLMRGGIRTG